MINILETLGTYFLIILDLVIKYLNIMFYWKMLDKIFKVWLLLYKFIIHSLTLGFLFTKFFC